MNLLKLKINKVCSLPIVFLLLACSTAVKQNSTATNILENLVPQIDSLMRVHKLTGLSIAVVDNSAIMWHSQFGYKEAGKEDKIDENTAFSTASISKAITATTCLILEESGRIDIDVPIRNYLKRWQLPKSEYLKKTDLTIRHLLSHTGGTSHSGYADFYGTDLVPTPLQVLNGELLPNYTKGIDILFEPGTNALYSGGGYVIIQVALEDTLGKSFEEIVRETLFKPLQMKHTTMLQPNQNDFSANVAKVHNGNQEVIKTGLPICPQLAPSGTWSTSKDLALFAIETQKAINGENTKVISPEAAKKLAEIETYKYAGGGTLGWQRSYAFGNLDWLSIMGQNTGVGGEVNLVTYGDKAIVMLANGEATNRLPVFSFLRSEIIERLGWGKVIDEKTVPLDKDFVQKIVGSYADFLYGDFEETVSITSEKNQLFVNSQILKLLTGSDRNRMYHLGDYIFKIDAYPNYVAFSAPQTAVDTIKIYRSKNEKKERMWAIPVTELKTVNVQLIDAFATKDFQNSIERFKAIKRNEHAYDFTNSLLELGILFYKRNNVEKSLKILEYNAKAQPENPDSFDALAQINERVGNTTDAIKYYKELLQLTDGNKNKENIQRKINELSGKKQ